MKRYKAPNGINQHKDKFHKLFGKGDNSITDKRPLDNEFKGYCIKDVLDLPSVKNTMIKGLNKHLLTLLGSLYSNQNKN